MKKKFGFRQTVFFNFTNHCAPTLPTHVRRRCAGVVHRAGVAEKTTTSFSNRRAAPSSNHNNNNNNNVYITSRHPLPLHSTHVHDLSGGPFAGFQVRRTHSPLRVVVSLENIPSACTGCPAAMYTLSQWPRTEFGRPKVTGFKVYRKNSHASIVQSQ